MSGGWVIVVVCDQHRRDHIVTHYHRLPGAGWEEFQPPTAGAARQSSVTVGAITMPPRPRSDVKFIVDDAEVNPRHVGPDGVERLRKVYPNRCDRCGANLPRRAEKLDALLDALARAGVLRVTLRELAAVARRLDTPGQ